MKVFLVAVLALGALPLLQAEEKTPLPKILLMGDSIRMGYAPLVSQQLKGQAVVLSPKENAGDTNNTLRLLDGWLKETPDIIHWNNGLHDLKFDRKSQKHQVPLEDYEKNLQLILDRIRKSAPKATIIFATTTPIMDERHAQRKAAFDRFEKDVVKYNEVAVKVMKSNKIAVHDLHQVVVTGGMEKWMAKDGTHYTPTAKKQQALAVVNYLKPWLQPK